MLVVDWLIGWPERVARDLRLAPLAPFAARVCVGWVFLWAGWAKLNNFDLMVENFTEWGIPFPAVMTPFVSAVEFVGGILLLLGLMTRISGGALAITMIVATWVAKWGDVDSLATLLGFEEIAYLAIFQWLAIAGPGAWSLDHLLLLRTSVRPARA
jgi:putative oxidoreductase